MNKQVSYRSLLAVAALGTLASCAPQAADGETTELKIGSGTFALSADEELVAFYRFEPGALLTDSSGNGNHLFSGNPASWLPSTTTPAPNVGSTQAARFDETEDILRTAAPLALSQYKRIHADWWMRPRNAAGATGIVFEHSGDFNSAPGGFLAGVQNAPSGGITGAAGLNVGGAFNLDAFDDGPTNVWQHVDLFIDTSAGRAADVVRISKNGSIVASSAYLTHQGAGSVSLRDDWFVIGARGGSQPFPYHFNGDIDELRISRDARLLAWWRFEPGASFLTDSSGAGHNLQPVPGTAQPTSITTLATGARGSGAASFQSSNRLRSSNAIDFSPYRKIRVSAWIREKTAIRGVAWEHGNSFLDRPGSVTLTFNDDQPGVGLAGYWSGASDPALDQFQHESQANASWHYVVVDYDHSAPSQSAVRVFVDGHIEREDADHDRYALGTAPFLNDFFFVGGRGAGSFDFAGDIDELKIEGFFDSRSPSTPVTKLYILAGQSNALGQAISPANDAAFRVPQWGSWIWNQGDWYPVQPGFGWLDDRFGPEVSFASRVFECTQERVAIVKYAVGATNLYSDWKASTGIQYQGLERAIAAARTSLPNAELAGVLWMQGESDALENQGSSYQANLESFITQLRSDLGKPNLPFAIGQVRSEWDGDPLDVRRAQQLVTVGIPPNVAPTRDKAALVSTDDLSIYPNSDPENKKHFDDIGMRTLGRRFAAGLLGSSCPP